MALNRPDEVHGAFEKAFNAQDKRGLLAIYEPGAKLITGPGQDAAGHDAIRTALERFLELKGTMKMETVYVIENGELAMTRARWKLNGTDAAGKAVSMEGNSIEILRRQPNRMWLVAIDNAYGAS